MRWTPLLRIFWGKNFGKKLTKRICLIINILSYICRMDAELKKLLYRENTPAYLKSIRKGKALYRAEIKSVAVELYFSVPMEEMGDASFFPEMDGKYLCRWYIENQ